MPRPRRYTDATVIAALKKTKGMVYLAAQVIGCDPGTIYDRAKASPAVQQCMADEDGMLNDICEMKLYELILAGDLRAIIYRLSTKARHRGYGDKLDIAGEVGAPVTMSEETKAALMDTIARTLLAMEEAPDDDASSQDAEAGAA
jgi:hypothetical protein